MKTHSLLAVMFLCFIQSVNAQSTFQKLFGGGGGDSGGSVILSSDSGYIISAYLNQSLFILKLDSIGDTIWSKTYDGIGSGSIAETADGSIVASGSAGFDLSYLMKLDSEGEVLWARTYNTNSYHVLGAPHETSDGGFIMTGFCEDWGAGYEDLFVLKTFNNGVIHWSRVYGGAGADKGKSVQQTVDGGYIVIGTMEAEMSPYPNDMFAIKINSDGDVIWSKSYSIATYDEGWGVKQLSDGGFILVGHEDNAGLFIVRIDSNGDVQWSKTYSDVSFLKGNFALTSDNGYIVVGVVGNVFIEQTDLLLLKLDSMGNLEWTSVFGGEFEDVGRSVVQANDGGYIAIGQFYGDVAGWVKYVYVVKTDSYGKVNCVQSDTLIATVNNVTPVVQSVGTIATPPTTHSSTSVTAISAAPGVDSILCYIPTTVTNISTSENQLQVRPNPLESLSEIIMDNDAADSYTVRIFNATGQLVQKNRNSQIIDREDLPSGLYYFNVSFPSENIKSGKFIVR